MGFTAQLSLRAVLSLAFDKAVITANPQHTCELQGSTHTGVPDAPELRLFLAGVRTVAQIRENLQHFPSSAPKMSTFFTAVTTIKTTQRELSNNTKGLPAEAELLIMFLFLTNYLLVINCRDSGV